MANVRNHAEAVAFLSSIPDPVVQAVIQHTHAILFTEVSEYFTTDVDLLLLYKLLEAVFRDRKRLANFLATESTAALAFDQEVATEGSFSVPSSSRKDNVDQRLDMAVDGV